MNFLEQYNLRPLKILKLVGIAVVIFVVGIFALQLVRYSFQSVGPARVTDSYGSQSYGDKSGSFNLSAPSGSFGIDLSEEAASIPSSFSLSQRNITPEPPAPGGTPGNDAEQFEVTQYTGRIESNDIGSTCKTILDLKWKDYVIFENSHEFDQGCNFTFKVAKDHVAEVVGVLQSLDPKELSENTYTIKRQIDDFTSEQEILTKKKESIEKTLDDALNSYSEIAKLATQTQNAQVLANVIDSKIRVIERLTQERLNVNEQLDRLSRAKAEAVDRLEYTYFNVSVAEKKYIDREALKDSWRAAVRDLVRNVNKALQGSTLSLITFFVFVIQYLLYIFILLVIAKYGWRLAKSIWEGPQPRNDRNGLS